MLTERYDSDAQASGDQVRWELPVSLPEEGFAAVAERDRDEVLGGVGR